MKPEINPSLKPLLKPMSEIRPDENNARKHSERSIKAIIESLSRHGQQKPIVIKDGVVIAGNGTYLAARRLCWDSIAVVEYVGDSHGHYAIADNRSAELSEWDFDKLSSQLDLFEKGSLFSEEELGNLRSADFSPAPVSDHDPKTFGLEKVTLTPDEYKIVQEAVKYCRANVGENEFTDGRIVSIICARYTANQMQEPLRHVPTISQPKPQEEKKEQMTIPGAM